MKKQFRMMTVGAMLALLFIFTTSLSACAETIESRCAALRSAESFDHQLDLLNTLATENAATLEMGGWENDLTVPAAPGLPDSLIPKDWDAYTYTEAKSFPKELRGRKFIALYFPDEKGSFIAGDLLARLPKAMRAASFAEAEYALIVRCHSVPSGYTYTIPASSVHRDYEGYAVNLKTGESTRFWMHRNNAKAGGKLFELNGDLFSQQELWTILRSYFCGELRYMQSDNTVLVFGLTGNNCYLKGFEGELTVLDVPAQVEGHTVTEIAQACFMENETLRTVILHEGMMRISNSAFNRCNALESVKLPDTLERIGENSFRDCSQLQQIELPGSIKTVQDNLLSFCSTLGCVVVEEGITSLSGNAFYGSENIACVYFPSSLNQGDLSLTKNAVIYAPEGSNAFHWAIEKGYETVACESPDEMPSVGFISDGDFMFRTFRGEAALSKYLGDSTDVIVPDRAGEFPVTRILGHSIYGIEQVESVTLPQSACTVQAGAVYAIAQGAPVHLYVSNPDTAFEKNAVGRFGCEKISITIHAPEGSLAQRYVVDTSDEPIEFEPWGKGINPDARSLQDALTLPAQVQNSVISFMETCDETAEYEWFRQVPSYTLHAPEAVAVLRVTQPQFEDLKLILGGSDRLAASFVNVINRRYNLSYAKAAAITAQEEKFDPVADGSCAFVFLCYQRDILFVTLAGDGNAQAALLCSGPETINDLTTNTINTIAAHYGVKGECTVYKADALKDLFAQ